MKIKQLIAIKDSLVCFFMKIAMWRTLVVLESASVMFWSIVNIIDLCAAFVFSSCVY